MGSWALFISVWKLIKIRQLWAWILKSPDTKALIYFRPGRDASLMSLVTYLIIGGYCLFCDSFSLSFPAWSFFYILLLRAVLQLKKALCMIFVVGVLFQLNPLIQYKNSASSYKPCLHFIQQSHNSCNNITTFTCIKCLNIWSQLPNYLNRHFWISFVNCKLYPELFKDFFRIIFNSILLLLNISISLKLFVSYFIK